MTPPRNGGAARFSRAAPPAGLALLLLHPSWCRVGLWDCQSTTDERTST